MAEWVQDTRYARDANDSFSLPRIENRDGIGWADAPLPSWLHRCKSQTRGWTQFGYVERCACGAMRGLFRGWTGKNETRLHNLRDHKRGKRFRLWPK